MAPPLALLDEILLRLPPDDPACLVHAALVCRAWCRLVADRGFRHRYCEFHRAAPMLGFFCGYSLFRTFFVCTTSFRPPHADDRLSFWDAVDSRHGRVLLYHSDHTFKVWDPTLSDQPIALPRPPVLFVMSWNAAVLCAANTTFDHIDCHRGPFLVVFLAKMTSFKIFISVYSSEDGSWSDPTITSGIHNDFARDGRACALVGNAVHFAVSNATDIIRYNLGTRQVSFEQPPPSHAPFALMTGEDGRLGLATVNNFRFCIWSREDVRHGDGDGWIRTRVIELKELLPVSSTRATSYCPES